MIPSSVYYLHIIFWKLKLLSTNYKTKGYYKCKYIISNLLTEVYL